MARKPIDPDCALTMATIRDAKRAPRQEQTVQDPALRVRPVEIVPEAKPDYILRREQRQAFADRVNGGLR